MAYQDNISSTSPDIYEEEFISLINCLSDSIKEYYKISKHNLKETNKFLENFENQWKSTQNTLNNIIQNSLLSNKNELFQTISQSQNIINQLQNNSQSNESNLNLFFEDAKILFKKMKSKRNKNLLSLRRSLRSVSNRNNNMNSNLNSSGAYDSYNKTNINNNSGIKISNLNKLIYYLNQLKDYNEIVGKFSSKAKFNFISLQNMIFGVLNGKQNNKRLNSYTSNSKYTESNSSVKINMTEPNDGMNIIEIKKQYENKILNLNNKIKDLEQSLNVIRSNKLENNKIKELKKKIEYELLNSHLNDNNIIKNNNSFENMILNLVDINKNANMELKNIKDDIQKKNEIIKKLNLTNKKLQYDIINKDNIIQEKENEIIKLSGIKSECDESNQKMKNINNANNLQKNIGSNNNTIIELRKQLKNMFNENNILRNQVNDLKINMIEDGNLLQIIPNSESLINNNEINSIKKQLELEKQNSGLLKIKYEKEINLINKKCEDLSKKLTSKTDEIISLQRENIKLKTTSNGKNNNLYDVSNKFTEMKNIQNYSAVTNNEMVKYKEENNQLKKMVNNMKKSLFKLTQEKKELNNQLMIQKQQIQNLEGNINTNYNKTIIGLQQESEHLRKITENNYYKSIEYEQQINNLQNILNEKDELINQYKDSIQKIKNNNMNKMNNQNDIINLQKINNNLMNQLQSKNKEIENIKRLLNYNENDNQKIVELKKIINDDKKQIQLLNKQIAELKIEKSANEQNELINKYKNEINELNNAFLKANSIIEEKDIMIKKLKENTNSGNNLQLKIEQLNKHINQLEQENKNLTDEIFKNNNLQNDDNINALNMKISNLKGENEYYKNKAEELQEQIKNIQRTENKNNNFNDNILEMIYDDKNNDELHLIKKENQNLEYNVSQLNQKITNLNKLNEKLNQELNQEKIKNSELLEKLKPNKNNIRVDNENSDIEDKLKRKEDELEAINTFILKLQKELEKCKEENDNYKLKINIIEKEKASLKKQLERLSIAMPKELNALQTQLEEAKKNQIMPNSNSNIRNNNQKNIFSSNSDRNKKKSKEKYKTAVDNNINIDKYNNLLEKYNEANEKISELKNKNKELLFQLEEKEVKSALSGFRTEDVNISNYEEEFDLRKMANGARDKNRSEDINIDYPGITGIKEKFRELEFRYKNLVEQVKILIGNITFNQKVKPQISQICQLLGYSPKTTGRILTSKDKKKILGI